MPFFPSDEKKARESHYVGGNDVQLGEQADGPAAQVWIAVSAAVLLCTTSYALGLYQFTSSCIQKTVVVQADNRFVL